MIDNKEDLGPFVRLKDWISERTNGGCRILSEGARCKCPLCDLDRIRDALRWYSSQQGKSSHDGH